MNTQSMVRTDFLLNRLYEVQNLQSEQKFVESLELIEKTLISEEMLESGDPSNAKIHFLYLKAIALDLSDRLDEALPIFFQLVTDYPGAPDFESSLQVVLSKLEHRVKEIIQATPDSPEIYRIFKIFERYSCPPYWLIHAVAAQEVADGKTEDAWKKMENLLALSPNDAEYLQCAMAIAKASGKIPLYVHLKKIALQLLEDRPYRLDLVSLTGVEESK